MSASIPSAAATRTTSATESRTAPYCAIAASRPASPASVEIADREQAPSTSRRCVRTRRSRRSPPRRARPAATGRDRAGSTPSRARCSPRRRWRRPTVVGAGQRRPRLERARNRVEPQRQVAVARRSVQHLVQLDRRVAVGLGDGAVGDVALVGVQAERQRVVGAAARRASRGWPARRRRAASRWSARRSRCAAPRRACWRRSRRPSRGPCTSGRRAWSGASPRSSRPGRWRCRRAPSPASSARRVRC